MRLRTISLLIVAAVAIYWVATSMMDAQKHFAIQGEIQAGRGL